MQGSLRRDHFFRRSVGGGRGSASSRASASAAFRPSPVTIRTIGCAFDHSGRLPFAGSPGCAARAVARRRAWAARRRLSRIRSSTGVTCTRGAARREGSRERCVRVMHTMPCYVMWVEPLRPRSERAVNKSDCEGVTWG